MSRDFLLKWDSNSDQPFVEMSKNKKKVARLKQIDELLKIAFVNIFLFPFFYLKTLFNKTSIMQHKVLVKNRAGVAVNLDKYPLQTKEYLDDLGVKNITVRFFLWDYLKIDEYVEFLKILKDYEILVVIVQDRELLDKKEFEEIIGIVFKKFIPYAKTFQFGIAINRYKWGYFSTKEYLKQFSLVYKIKNLNFPHITLIGSSVIDFEFMITIRTVINFYKLKYDGISTLLYVDRRGTPENRQMGLDLFSKIKFLENIINFSSKVSKKTIYITETNWPLKGTYPYIPTSEDECVSEIEQSIYLVKYYLFALANSYVEKIFWHQLFSIGFGLVDLRDELRKRDSFKTLQQLIKFLGETTFDSMKIDNGLYTIKFYSKQRVVLIYWHKDNEIILDLKNKKKYDIFGNEIFEESFKIRSIPIYVIEDNEYIN